MFGDSLERIDDQNDVCLVWEAISSVPMRSDSVLIRVFKGNKGSEQYKHFSTALSRWRIPVKYKIEYIDTDEVKKRFKKPSELVDWLLGCHVHFILGHVHQGIVSQKDWHMDDLRSQLVRLKFHAGFPNGTKLQCPVFTQNKIRYIRAIEELANPTLAILLREDFDYTSNEAEIEM
jgi:hypothetical protein